MEFTLKFFKEDKPAAQFEADISCGGHFPCVGCVCSASRFSDFANASYCDQRTFESIQKVALKGVYGKKQGHLKFYDNLNAEELRKENGKLGILKNILCGVQRVPSLMMFSPESNLEDFHLNKYCVLPFEPLHDLKGYLGGVLKNSLPLFLWGH